jgi:hypothetical protein
MAALGSLGSLVIELAANTARLQSDMGKAVGIAQSAAGKLQSAFKFAGGGLLGGAVIGIAQQAIELGDNLNKAAIKAGVSGRAISELAFAAGQADIELASLSNALRFMQTNLSKAASGSKEANNVLSALGLTIEGIKGLQADKQFELIADRVASLTDPADRARASVELFGKSGAELLPLFEQGAEGIRKAREEAQRLGASLTDQQIQKLAEADDAIKRLSQSWQNFAARLTSFVAPALTAVLDQLSGANVTNDDRLKLLRSQLDSIKDGYNEAAKAALRLQIQQLESQAALEQQRAVGAGGPSRRRAVFAVGFEAAAEEAKAVAKEVASSFELDPETLDRIAFEDWKRQTIDNMDEVIRAGADMEDEISGYADEMANSWEGASESISTFADQAARNMQDAFADFLFDPFENGIKGMLKGFVDILRRMVAEAAAAKVFEALGFGQGGGSGGLLGKLFGGLLGGGGGSKVLFPMPRALGGPVTAGAPYLVGERGPELFVPGVSGGIVPNGRMGGGVVIAPTYNIDARGATSELINALPEILRRRDASLREDIIEGLRRGRY